MQDLTTGSVSRHLLKTTGFMLVTMAAQTLYFLIDLYWVGRLGKEAVAGVGVAGNLMFVVLAITQMLAVGATTLVSHATGRKDHERALLVFNQSLVLAAIVGVAFFVVAMLFRVAYCAALSADAPTASLAEQYLLWFLPAAGLQFPMIAMSAALRGTGNFKPGMIVQTSTVVLNMLLAPFLIFGWLTHRPLGVAGAAIATLIAVVVGTLWLSRYFTPRDAYLRFVPADWGPQVRMWGDMIKIGLPAGVEFALMGVYLFVIYAVCRPFGAEAQAGFGIGSRIIQAGFMPVVALGFAVAPVAGQNFGARKADRVRGAYRSAVTIGAIVMFVFAVLCHIAPAAMVRLFSSDPRVVAIGEDYLRIVSWNFIASGIVFVNSSMFQAMGNTIPSLITSFVRITIVVIPALLLPRVPGFQLKWVWYLTVVSIALQMVLSLILLQREFRTRLAFESRPAPAPEAIPAPAVAASIPAGDPAS
jgi:putative MATE family efflux protein